MLNTALAFEVVKLETMHVDSRLLLVVALLLLLQTAEANAS